MEKPEKDAIRSLLNFLCENTTAVEELTTHARSASLMTESEREKILAHPTQYLQNHEFYAHMMKKPNGMDYLLRFLRDVLNGGVAQRLKEQLTIEKISIRFQNTQLASSSSSSDTGVPNIQGYDHPNISAKPAAQLPLRTHFNLHFPSRYFTGRKSHLLALDKTVKRLLEEKSPRNKTVVISGLGGVGKTELVREYATTTDAVTYVIVINAASYTTAKKDFNDLAIHVQIKKTSDQNISMDQTIYDVYRYFSLKMDGKTLFIFENAGHWAKFAKFLPNESVGTGNNQLPIVMIISRLNDWELPSEYHLRIDGWDREETVDYLTCRLLTLPEVRITEVVKTWLYHLGDSLYCFPLGLSIAISKILKDHQHATWDKVRQYLLAKEDDHDTWRIQEISNSAPTDYKLTMDTVFNADIQNIYLNKDNGVTALHLLRLVSTHCHVHPEGNPQITSSEMQDLCVQNKVSRELAEALNILYNYSIFVRHANEHGELISSQIHDIIQLCRGKWTGSCLEEFCNRNEIWV